MPNKQPHRTWIGLLGGSFDPIHYGHLHLARIAMAQLPLTQVRFLPARAGAHKTTFHASDTQRLAMLSYALAGEPDWVIDTRDLDRAIPTRTIDTLIELETTEPEKGWVVLMGCDQWAAFTNWQRWQDILRYAHIAVLSRTGITSVPRPEQSALQWRTWTQLRDQKAGGVIQLQAKPYLCSSTMIREKGTWNALPPCVRRYIDTHHLYKRTNHDQ